MTDELTGEAPGPGDGWSVREHVPYRVSRLFWSLVPAVGIGGELIFGLVMGMGLSLAFVAVNWAGDIMGQLMGMNMAATFDPQFGGSSLVGDLYFMLALITFLLVRGHHAMILGLADSFEALPLLSAPMMRRCRREPHSMSPFSSARRICYAAS